MRSRLAFVCCLTGVLLGCNAVTSLEPAGGPAVRLDSSEWEGTWSAADGAVSVRIVDSLAGELEAAWLEVGDSGIELETVEIHLREAGQETLASIRERGEGDQPFEVFLMTRHGDQVFLWWPDADQFKELVARGQLPGSIESESLLLGKLEPRHLDLITSDESGALYRWKEPLVLARAGG